MTETFMASNKGQKGQGKDLEVFEAMRKRRATRTFSDRPVETEALSKLVFAAHRAPTGGNTPYRRVMVVNDQKTLRVLKQVAPGIIGNPTAVMVIYTDLKVAAEHGSSTQYSSLVDAGAAAENVALAAAALGLGCCFTMSYSEAAVKELLGIPEDFRTGVILQLGYPSDRLPPSVRQKPEGRITELNRFGNRWDQNA